VLVPGLVSSGMTLDGRDFRDADLPAGELDFISAIGWVVFFFMFRTETDVDPDAGLDAVDQSETVSDAEPKHDS
jgi:putative heme transporter